MIMTIGSLGLIFYVRILVAIRHKRIRVARGIGQVVFLGVGLYGVFYCWSWIEGPLRLEPSPVARVEIARELGTGKNGSAGRYLLWSLEADRDTRVRAASACALGELRHHAAVQPILARAMDISEADDVKICALRALRQLGDPQVVTTLISLLTETSGPLRIETIQTLGALRDARAVPVLIGVVVSPRGEDDRVAAQRAIGALGSSALPEVRQLFQQSPQLAIEILRYMGEPGVSELLSIYRSSPAGVRNEAVRAILLAGNQTGVSTMRDVMSTNLALVQQAHRSLIELGDGSFVPLLVGALDRYGDATMAVAYLNCGEATLATAARRWASAHGYEVSSSFASNGSPRWGRR
jgi:HEAT repeat protein